MKQTTILFSFLAATATMVAQNVNIFLERADSLFKEGKYQESAKEYNAYFDFPNAEVSANQMYRAAVSFSKTGMAEEAVHWLQRAVDKGIDDQYLTEIRFDFNFYPIRHTSEWKSFFDTNTAPFDEEAQRISHPQIRHELLELWQADQYYRRLIFGRYNGRPPNEIGRVTEAVDRYNAERLEQILDEIGLPSYSNVGKDGAHAAWNIIQHAVFNPPLMGRYLKEMKVALEKNEVDGVDYAYLFDRYHAVCYLGKQDYGIVRNVPIRDEHLVEQRRKQMGFKVSLEEYLGAYTPITEEAYQNREKELAQKYSTNLEKGKEELSHKNYKAAFQYFKEVMKCNGYIKTEDIYSMAKIHGEFNTRRSKFQAIRYIRCLSARGFNDLDRLNADSSFNALREEKGFKEALNIIKKYNLTSSKK